MLFLADNDEAALGKHADAANVVLGDASMAGKDEVERLVRGGSARVVR